MKKAFSILFLVIFLFNVGGYYLVFWALQRKAEERITQQIDRELYAASETVTIKIPLSLPYPIFENGFERAKGKFSIDGEHYQLIKQRLEHDTVYLVCVRDVEAQRLDEAMIDYALKTSDSPATSGELSLLVKLAKDYFGQEDTGCVSDACAWARSLVYGSSNPVIDSRALPVLSPPPNA